MLKKIHLAKANTYVYLAESIEDSDLLYRLEKKKTLNNYFPQIDENTKFHFVNKIGVVKNNIMDSYSLEECDFVIIPSYDIICKTILLNKKKNGKLSYLQYSPYSKEFSLKKNENLRLGVTGWITKYSKEELEILEKKTWIQYYDKLPHLTFLRHEITLTEEEFNKMLDVKDTSIRSVLTLNYQKSLHDLMLLKYLTTFASKSYHPISYIPIFNSLKQLVDYFENHNVKIPEWVLIKEYKKAIDRLIKEGTIIKPINEPQWYVSEL